MQDVGKKATEHDMTRIARDRLLHRLTRRSLLRGAGGLGAGALALGAGLPHMAAAGTWTPPTTTSAFRPDVALEWLRLAFSIMPTTPGFSPGVADRALAYLAVTLYETVAPGMPGHASLAGTLNDLTPVPGQPHRAYHWPSCANSALAQSVRSLFRMTTEENMAAIDALEASIAAKLAQSIPPGIGRVSARRGRRVADHIMAWAATDRANSPTGPYVPPVGPGLWEPTPPGFVNAADPFGGTARPLALGPVEDYNPGPPPAFSTDPASEFYAGELEVYEAVNGATEEQLTIAEYWARTVGHRVSIFVQAIEQSGVDLATTAQALARAAISAHDGAIACFYSKYAYNLLRPVTYIQSYIDADWPDPPVVTPPHPDYPAAHATVSRAFAQGMYEVLGDFHFTDSTWVDFGLAPRSFSSWFEMAEEAGISRLYGGIHTRWAIDVGLEQGRQVGVAVSSMLDA